MSVLVFEDGFVTDLYPVTISRPAYTISCGSYRLLDLLGELGLPIRWLVRPHLAEIQAEDFGGLQTAAPGNRQPLLLVNAALVPSVAVIARLRELVQAGSECVVRGADDRVAAVVVAPATNALAATTYQELVSAVDLGRLPALDVELPLFRYPHEIIRQHVAILRENLEHRIARGQYREDRAGVFVGQGAELGDYLVTDTRQGPIVVDEAARIGPYTYLSGPAYVGPRSRIIEHSAIKDAVSLGHTTKIGGEVEASVIEPYTNKQHHGFLGHSYLGSWINLGAGTCNSDLKNTYGQVNMEYYGRKVPSGMQFVGTIMGDYAKTAINTGIFTGKTIGVCSMIYGFVTTNVPSFVNYARLFGQVTETPVDVMIATQGRMFARRNVAQRPCDIQLLRDMYELTRNERQIAGDPLQL